MLLVDCRSLAGLVTSKDLGHVQKAARSSSLSQKAMEDDHTVEREDDSRMAIRLLATLQHQEQTRHKKRRWILERWPETARKREKLSFLKEKFVPESDVREEKDVLGMISLIERTMNTLCANHPQDKFGSCVNAPLSEFPLDKVQELPDQELIKRIPSLLDYLSKQALRDLLRALTASHLIPQNRLTIKNEIRREMAKIVVPSSDEVLPEPLLEAALVLRSPSSFRRTSGLNLTRFKLFTHMPSSALAAAHEAFAHVDKLPTRNLEEVRKMLMGDCAIDLLVRFRALMHSHRFTANSVRKKASNLLNQVKEGDQLPDQIEGALRVISLSARVLYGDDGGLKNILRQLSPAQLSLEDEYLAAFTQLEKMEVSELAKVQNMFIENPSSTHRSKRFLYISQIQGILTSCMHFIYAGTFPEPVAKAMSIINSPKGKTIPGFLDVKLDLNEGMPRFKTTVFKERKKEERIRAELEAVLAVSAHVQKMVWEYCDSFEKDVDGSAGVDRRWLDDGQGCVSNSGVGPSSLEVTFEGAEIKPSAKRIQSKAGLDRKVQEGLIDTLVSDNKMFDLDNKDFVQEVEKIADEASTIAYVLIGHILNEMSLLHCSPLDGNAVEYLRTGLEDLKVSGAENIQTSKSSRNTNAGRLVLNIAKKLDRIPKCVVREVELQLNLQNG